MVILKVEDMHCEHCVSRIEEAFKEEGLSCEVNLANKTVAVEESLVEKASETLDDLGFDCEKV